MKIIQQLGKWFTPRSKESGEKPSPSLGQAQTEKPSLPNTTIRTDILIKTKVGRIEFESEKGSLWMWRRTEYRSADNLIGLNREDIKNLIEAAQEFLIAIETKD